ncbi:MAG: phosphoribosylformylglycinamidine synthase-associated small membrane protein [Hyphomicrobiaceae bacterium]|nr:hypothetical protein [Hyphomicrobiaceae bacterium]
MVTTDQAPTDRVRNDDATKAVRFLAIKAAIFILIPAVAAMIAVYLRFG